TDYRAVNQEYGTLQDLDDLIAEAHRRGVRILLDIPFNHTSDRHPWFRQAVEDPASRFRKFYHFADIDRPAPPGSWHIATDSRGKKVRHMGLFSPSMPDLDFRNPEVRREVEQIAQFWLDRGVDGFRLDAAKHVFGDTFGRLPEADILRNNEWWREFSDSVYRRNAGAVLVGEVLGDREQLRRHAYGLDGLVDAPFLHDARSRIASPGTGLVVRWKEEVGSCRDVNRAAHQGPGSLPRADLFQPFVFLSSHDENPRLASYLGEKKSRGMQPSVDEAYRLGMYILTSIGRYPILYYGDELMQPGFKWNGNPPDAQPPGDGSRLYDETLREPFPWHAAGDDPAVGDGDMQTSWSSRLPIFDRPGDGVSVEEQDRPGQMLRLVRALTNLRTEHPDYANGDVGEIPTDSTDWLVFEKVGGRSRYLVLINTTDTGKDYRFQASWLSRYQGAELIFWSDGRGKSWKDETTGGKRIEAQAFVPPYGMVVLRQKLN
ncbi:MAG: alpha-amylase family glycosyl hydrolase, partial [Isosphaeraceae bacterium]